MSHQQRCSIVRRTFALAAVLFATAVPAAHAAAGDVDRTFGHHGVFARWSGAGPWTDIFGAWPGGRNRTVVETDALRRLDARGRVDPTFGDGGRVTSPYTSQFTRFPGGAWVVGQPGPRLGPERIVVGAPELRDRDGHVDPRSDAFSAAVEDVGGATFDQLFPLTDGSVLDISRLGFDGPWKVTKIGLDGQVLSSTSVAPHAVIYSWFSDRRGLTVSSYHKVIRLRNDGSLDPRWATRSIPAAYGDIIDGILPWDHGGAVAVTATFTDPGHFGLVWFDRRGHVVHERRIGRTYFGTTERRKSYTYAVATDRQGRTLLARSGHDYRELLVWRLRRDAHTDRRFGRRGVVRLRTPHHLQPSALTVQPDGRVIVVATQIAWGPVLHDREDIPSPDWSARGVAVWRLLAH